MQNSKILILGGTGFIGRHLVRALKKHHYKNITVASRNFPQEKIPYVKYFDKIDLTDPATLEPLIKKAEIVINLAGYISYLKKDRAKIFKINAEGPKNLLRLLEQTGNVRKFIQISSAAVFGFRSGTITENTSFNWKKYHWLSYSYSKSLANDLIDRSQQPSNIVYPPLVLGPGSTENAKRLFQYIRGKKRLFASPGCNALVDVRDLAEALVLILEKAKNKENYLVAGENLAVKKLFSGIAEALKQKSRILVLPRLLCRPLIYLAKFLEFCGFRIPVENIFLGFQKRKFSAAKIRQDLGFKPQFNYKKTLRDTYGNS